MRYLIVSDMHGNCDAFSAVLRKVRRKRFDAVLVLGDLVGYGGGPNQIVEAIRELPGRVYAVRGNHDKVVAGIEDGSNFNNSALLAARWTAQRMTPSNLRYVRELPRGPMRTDDGVVICHGSPLDEDAYVFSDYDAFEIFAQHDAQVTFFGHTHVPSLFALNGRGIEVSLLRGESGTIEIQDGRRYLINPGSIGQPRDRDPRAAYMIYDGRRRVVHWHRVEYPIDKARARIVAAGLPKVLGDRLTVGA